MRNAEFGTGNGEGEMADVKCRMADDKWGMGDDKCRDETGQPRFPGAKKWVAPAAPLVPAEGGEPVASGEWNRRERDGTDRKQ